MKKYIVSLMLFSFIVFPVISIAQESTAPLDPSCFKLENNLRYKDRDKNKNNEVSLLQKFLKSKEYLSVSPTGYFGVSTLKAVKDFQKENKITPTGYVGPTTRSKIQEISCISTAVLPPLITNDPVNNNTLDTTTPPVVVDPTPVLVPALEILSPNGGGYYKPGRQLTITWKSSNMTEEDNVYLSLVKESNGLIYVLSESTKNDGTETFTIPTNIREGKYKAYVKKVGTSIEDYSGDTFRIEN